MSDMGGGTSQLHYHEKDFGVEPMYLLGAIFTHAEAKAFARYLEQLAATSLYNLICDVELYKAFTSSLYTTHQ